MLNKRQLMFCCINLPAEEGDTGPVTLCRVQEFKCVVRGSCRSSKYTHDQRRIISTDLFHGGGAIIGDLQELRPGYGRNAREQTNDMVVQKGWNGPFRDPMHVNRNVWAEDFQKMLEP